MIKITMTHRGDLEYGPEYEAINTFIINTYCPKVAIRTCERHIFEKIKKEFIKNRFPNDKVENYIEKVSDTLHFKEIIFIQGEYLGEY